MAVAIKPVAAEWTDEEIAVKVRVRVKEGLDAGQALHVAATTASDEIIDQGWAEAMFRLFGSRIVASTIWGDGLRHDRQHFFAGEAPGTGVRRARGKYMQADEVEGEPRDMSILDLLLFRCGESRYIPLGDMTQTDCLVQHEKAQVLMQCARKRIGFWQQLAIGLDRGQTVRQRYSEQDIGAMRNRMGMELESDPPEEA